MQRALDAPNRRGFGPVVMVRLAVDDSGLATFDSTRAAEFAALRPRIAAISAAAGALTSEEEG